MAIVLILSNAITLLVIAVFYNRFDTIIPRGFCGIALRTQHHITCTIHQRKIVQAVFSIGKCCKFGVFFRSSLAGIGFTRQIILHNSSRCWRSKTTCQDGSSTCFAFKTARTRYFLVITRFKDNIPLAIILILSNAITLLIIAVFYNRFNAIIP